MKRNYILISMALLGLASCETDFLDRAPLTEITDTDFFKSASDLEIYSNGFYEDINASYQDPGTDNDAINLNGQVTMNQVVTGTLTSANAPGWTWSGDWAKLRSYNYFLQHAQLLDTTDEEIAHYIGIGRFFRAYFYADMVKSYSDVPWYNEALSADSEEMYKACDPRAMVMDSVMNDLQYAVDHISEDIGTRTRISKWAALALQARVALYEGTYRKYHAEIGLQGDYERFLEKAVEACETIMSSGQFSLYGNSGADYGLLFNSPSLDSNPEVILQRASDKSLGVSNNTSSVQGWQWSLSRSLMETYLMADGSRFTDQPGDDRMGFKDVFEGRDPRFKETFTYPGFKRTESGSPYIPKITAGCYDQLKFYPRDESLREGWDMDYTSLPIFRYGEVLLNYAEAKAELGTLTQEDLDRSINLLRARVQMPAMSLSDANAHPDAWLIEQYPNVSGTNRGVILKIRRERRVETACEGLRWNDIQRWAVGELFALNNEGAYFPSLGAFDITGDDREDIAILANPSNTLRLQGLPADVRSNLTLYYLEKEDGTDDGFYLSEGESGHINFTSYLQNPRHFISPKHYYLPIPLSQMTLNPNLKQPYGWE